MYLFLSGCPRSGTTVLARLLNLHPEIVLGIERFKRLVGPRKPLLPSMLEEEFFFNFQPDQTNFQPDNNPEAAEFYQIARAKFSTAKFIGDKYPQYFRYYRSLFQYFPEAKIVFIMRDPIYVAQSWQRRSEDSSSWPEKNDAVKSIAYWNDALAYTLAYTRIKKESFVFVDYEELFEIKEQGLLDLFQRIGVDTSPAVLAKVAELAVPYFSRSEEIVHREIELPKDVVEQVVQGADRNLLQCARHLIKSQRKRLQGQA